jgi:hypothetical protein
MVGDALFVMGAIGVQLLLVLAAFAISGRSTGSGNDELAEKEPGQGNEP